MKPHDWIEVGMFSAAFVGFGLWLRAKRRAEAHAREAERRDDTHDRISDDGVSNMPDLSSPSDHDDTREAPIDLPADEPLPEWPWVVTRITFVVVGGLVSGAVIALVLLWAAKL